MVKAILSDCDYTVWDRQTGEVYKSAKVRLQALPSGFGKAFCTNQGGVGFKFWAQKDGWADPRRWKGERAIRNQYEDLIQNGLGLNGARIYYAFRCKSKNGTWGPAKNDRPEWSREWRKPEAGMLLQALLDLGVAPDEAIYIGDDRDEEHPDSEAASGAGIPFLKAPDAWDDEEFWKSLRFHQVTLFDMAVAGKVESDLSNLIDTPRKLTTAEAMANLNRIADRVASGDMPDALLSYGGREGAAAAAKAAIAAQAHLVSIPKKKRGRRK